jgi:O-antigen/teichoic acid export membrane protein
VSDAETTTVGPPPTPDPAPGPRFAGFPALAKQSLVYGLSGVALQVVGIITLPVFSRAFDPAEYGLLELGLVASALALAVADAGFASAAQRSYFDYTDADAARRKVVLLTAFVTTSGLAVGLALGAVLLREQIADALFQSRGRGELVATIALTVPLVTMANFLREAMRLRFRAWHYVVSSVLAAFVAAAAGVVAVVAFDSGVTGVFVGVALGNTVAIVYGALTVRTDLAGRLSRFELNRMLRFGLPLVPAAIAMWGLFLLDRIMLGQLSDLAEVGQYAVASRVSSVLVLGVTGFMLALGPFLFSIYADDPEYEKEMRSRTLTYFTVGMCAAGLALTLFAREIIAVVAPDYDRAYKAVGLAVLAVVGFGIASVAMAGISLARRTLYFPLLAGTAAVTNVALNFVLIPPFGMVGAALAAAAALGLLATLQYRVSQRVYPTPFAPRKPLTAVALAAGLGLVGLWTLEPLALALAVKLGAALAFLLLLRPLRVLSAVELGQIRDLARGVRAGFSRA